MKTFNYYCTGDKTLYTCKQSISNKNKCISSWWDCGHQYETEFEQDYAKQELLAGRWSLTQDDEYTVFGESGLYKPGDIAGNDYLKKGADMILGRTSWN